MTMLEYYSAYEIVMMVHELHLRGYEQLRLFPGMSPNGCSWRWMIYPKVLIKDNEFEKHGDCTPFECLRGSTGQAVPENKQNPILVEEFIKGFEGYIELAKGEDKEYVKWYQTIVEHAQNNDFPIAFADFYRSNSWKFLRSDEQLLYPPFSSRNIDTLTDEQMIEYAKYVFDESSIADLNETINFDGRKMTAHDIAETIHKALREEKKLVSHYDSDEDIMEIFAV